MPPLLNGVVRLDRIARKWTAVFTAVMICGLLLLPSGCQQLLKQSGAQRMPATAPSGRMQEVAPPEAVRQLQEALLDRDPRVRIDEPQDGSTLPLAEWTLRLYVRDWPLVDAGQLGLGPHLAVQIDDQPPLRLTEHRSTPAGDVVELRMPALAPGSHRITAYAARPWGEAVKNPGASARLRVQALVANPLALPPPGTPELIVVSPADLSRSEPVLLDWLLYDAPLQRLTEGDDSWRLRVTVNGESFLLDQNMPLWLKGWGSGSNALVMELLDGRGEPLNPPFNTRVREVSLTSSEQPRLLAGALAPDELAALLGEGPVPPAEPPIQVSSPEETPTRDAVIQEEPNTEAELPERSDPEELQGESAAMDPITRESLEFPAEEDQSESSGAEPEPAPRTDAEL